MKIMRLFGAFDRTKLVPQIDRFFDDHVGLFVVFSVAFDDFHCTTRILLVFEADSGGTADDDEEENHNLV
jgi:hypothetical protein